ncbi:MAG TPA: SCE4755 family polysaccharide monooxygenase-like protein [Bdellovibrionales bacterium]|nr:SCE4755 family polysaccharide monooxygenase-like protein [Bdellovibrionales bacterium]
MKHLLTLAVTLFCSAATAHVRLNTPAGGRNNNNDSIKFTRQNPQNTAQSDVPSPCGSITTPTATRLQFQPGQTVTFNWTETINHPGRYIVQFTPCATTPQAFWLAANELGRLEDTMANATQSMTVQIPNINCGTCMLRFLQVMDEQPGEYYVHCLDIRVGTGVGGCPSQPTPTPSGGSGGGGNSGASGDASAQQAPRMGGCATVEGGGPGGSGSAYAFGLGCLAILGLWSALRLRAASQFFKS